MGALVGTAVGGMPLGVSSTDMVVGVVLVVGTCVGSVVGTLVGPSVGSPVVDTSVGTYVGACVAVDVDASVGTYVGACVVGAPVGIAVGTRLGRSVLPVGPGSFSSPIPKKDWGRVETSFGVGGGDGVEMSPGACTGGSLGGTPRGGVPLGAALGGKPGSLPDLGGSAGDPRGGLTGSPLLPRLLRFPVRGGGAGAGNVGNWEGLSVPRGSFSNT